MLRSRCYCLATINVDETEENEEDDEVVFKYKLTKLRKESEVFLKMLNDMRKRVRELPEDSPVAEQYKM